MPAQYSILQILLRPQIDEYLAVGLLLFDEGQVHFAVSEDKVRAAKSLLSTGAGRLLSDSIRDIKRVLSPSSSSDQGVRNSVFTQPAYLEYVSRYHNNLLRFTAPEFIRINPTPEHFSNLFHTLIFHAQSVPVLPLASASPFDSLRNTFYPRIRNRVNAGFTLTPSILPSLFVPTSVSFIGQNEVQVVGQEINFAKKAYNLGKDLNDMYALIKAFEADNKVDGKYFLLGNEPPTHSVKQHEMWVTMQNSPFVEVVPIAESERVSSYLEMHDVRPYVAEQQLT